MHQKLAQHTAAFNPAVTRGYNFGNWMAMVDQGEALAKTPAASLRFPGGNIGDEQDMDGPSLDTFRSLLTLERVVAGRACGVGEDRA